MSEDRGRSERWMPWLVAAWLLPAATVSAAGGEQPAASPPAMVTPLSETDHQQIASAVPDKAPATPARPRRLLIYDGNVGYPGHRSIPFANEAFRQMGQRTGAFETTISRDPAVFTADQLSKFDAVFFNNTVGNLFQDRQLRWNLAEFVYAGGGLMGVHGTTVAFTEWPGAREDWPEFGVMIGARGASHRDNDELVVMHFDDPDHPVLACFGGRAFSYRDEFFRVHEPYSRDRVRVLMSFDTQRTDMQQGLPRGRCERADSDYAVAWVRGYGRGRVLYCTIAHNPYVFWDKPMLRFYLAATQFVLGDLPGPTLASGFRTPGTDARELLGWRLALAVEDPSATSLFQAAQAARNAGIHYLEVSASQPVGGAIAEPFDPRLSREARERIRLGMDAAGVRMLSCRVSQLPAETSQLRELFGFVHQMGIETIRCPLSPASRDRLQALCDAYALRLARLPDADEGSGSDVRDGDPSLARLFTTIDAEQAEPSLIVVHANSRDPQSAAELRARVARLDAYCLDRVQQLESRTNP